jgi:uncharacterized protein (UPF0276 family)
MRRTTEFLEETDMAVFSEHLAFHRLGEIDVEMFLPMPFDEASLDFLIDKYRAARDYLGRPFALENVSYYFPIPQCPLSEATFLARLLERTDCTLLLDVTNVFNNGQNHGYDPTEFIRALPGERVSQLHLAGGHYANGMWQDSHSSAVMDAVWPLFEEALRHTHANIVVLERDSNFAPFEAVMADVRRARDLFYRHRPASPAIQPQATMAPGQTGKAANAEDNAEPKFAELRALQDALLRHIAGEEQDHLSDDSKPPAWPQRLRACDGARLRMMREKYQRVESRAREEAREYRAFEWQQWLRQSGGS